MRRKSNLPSIFIMMIIIGVITSILSSDIPFGAMIQNWETTNLESLLEKLSMGLGFLALVALLVVLFFRSLWMKKQDRLESVWEEHIDKIED
jgi:hypothetical protein